MRRKHIDRTECYRREASACAAAAATMAVAEIEQAYLELEQGWLCLTAKRSENPDGPAETPPENNGSGRQRVFIGGVT